MDVKVYYRGPVVWNVVLFIFFSFCFLYLQEVFYNLSSILRKELLIEFVQTKSVTVTVYIIAAISVIRMSNFAKQLTLLVIGITTIQTILNLNTEFSKMILVLLFFYLLLFFYVYQFFSMDLQESFYNPGFKKTDLFSPMLTKIPCDVLDANNQVISSGFLTNWSREGCFIFLNDSVGVSNLNTLRVKFENHEFIQNGILASRTKNKEGLGLKFSKPNSGREGHSLGWTDFYEIIEQMGYSPERLA